MNSNRMVLIYTILCLMLIGSAVVLAKQVRHFMNEREDLTLQFQGDVVDESVVKDEIKRKEDEHRTDVLLTFSQTKVFRELATPVPFPTPTPIPLPTPTPIIPARGWTIEFATKKNVFLVDPSKSPVSAKLNGTVDNEYGEKFQILEIFPDMEFPRVKVKGMDSGTIGEINQSVKHNAAPVKKK